MEISTQGNEAIVVTRETVKYHEYNIGTDESVADPDVHYSQTQKWTYHLIRQEGCWLTNTKNFESAE